MSKSGATGVLLALLASMSMAQGWRGSEVVELRVNDAKGRSVEGARVTFTFQGVPGGIGPPIVATDAKGRAVLVDLAPGPWQVDVVHPEYLTYVAMVDLRRGKKPLVSASFLEAGGRSLSPLRVKFSKGNADEASPVLEARQPPSPPTAESEPAPVAQSDLQQPSERISEAEAPETETAAGAAMVQAAAPEEPTSAPPPAAAIEEPAATSAEATAGLAAPVEEPRDLDDAVETPAATIEEPRTSGDFAAAPPGRVAAGEAPEAAPDEVEGRGADSPQQPVQSPTDPPPLPVAPAEPTPFEEPPQPPEARVPTEPEAEPLSEIAEPSIAAPLPPEDALPAPADPGIVVTSFRDGSCADCQTAEWSIATSAPVAAAAPGATGSCGAEVTEAARVAMQGLANSIQLELARFIGPVADGTARQAIDLLEADLAEPFMGPLAPFIGGATSCQIVGVVIPKSLRFSRVRLTATDRQGTSECAPGQDCPIGEARWIGGARVIEGPSATVAYGVFENRATDRGRRAGVTVYFRPPNANWRPTVPAGP